MLRTDLNVFVLVVAVLSAVQVKCIPKYEEGGGFLPSSIDYMAKSAKTQDQIAMPSQPRAQNDNESSTTTKRTASSESAELSDRNQEARFGFTNIGGTGSGYGVTGYAPAKIDLGGVLLGAVIGVGTILVIPKLLYVLSGAYGAYARSDDSGLTQTMNWLDDTFARHGIDTTSCMQRAVCSYSQQAAVAVRGQDKENDVEKVSSLEKIVDAITTNQMFRTAMQGTAVQEAVDAGRSGQNCARTYPQCGLEETALTLFSSILTVFRGINAQPVAPSAPQ